MNMNNVLTVRLSLRCRKMSHEFTRPYDANAKKFAMACVHAAAMMGNASHDDVTTDMVLYFPNSGAVIQQYNDLNVDDLSRIFDELPNYV